MNIKKLQKYPVLLVFVILMGMTQVALAAKPVMVDSNQNFEQTVNAIKGAIKKKNLAIVFEANHKNMIEMVGGQATPSIVIGFAKPQMGEKLLKMEPLAGIEMPMRIAIRELKDGKVKVIYYLPSKLFDSYNNPKLGKLGAKMDKMITMLVKAGTK
jgi:uncharacterized protein (DUF302 family)